ncbi:hypothetical protein A3D60_03850 [Candidatus Uhrbacteria bacterium RIFCSPHIGHO2_02_FULL_47_29]|uniref:Uncharacterized protein n=1 Tax=Candidatus Uhrbacteria bacterium RIFCSPLOWO2_01_FULL_47_25 TaxID=1802402 RepID=A0A1F7UXU0_9BACT|nr:MAG: hypothetical protein UX68_C0024G0014 [Parcubacteria group bacterium GW2011_GWA2_46_9]OGL61189.1 MAG: hypothetical protein A2752_02855 [Candidatus Uhrbacteria bacterium RIFCSPHIGHO2_01_FULL_46_23]OGL70578.1 MAG: hypothetical protein A3D60_03850 [Candidatus Uhrbacteria bacterium RIFCSPHIGHO2_02_FULL_47_29]OGL83111.1 MAG: hypothetical protein A2936_05355 [Candidatus Uhrbacteria bacterium RIFCSPLOWO2_01_FULL_47_25]OGL84485.1 MAG: hypothetical protein A3I37_03740 [Candidatus Uhrbacteria bact
MSLFRQPVETGEIDYQMYADAEAYIRGLRKGSLEDIAGHLMVNEEKAQLVVAELKRKGVIVLRGDGQWRVRRQATITRLPTVRASPKPELPSAMGVALRADMAKAETSVTGGMPTQTTKGGGEMSGDVRMDDLIKRADGGNQSPINSTKRKSKPSRPRDDKKPVECPRCKNLRVLDNRGLCPSCGIAYYTKGGTKKGWTLEEFIRQCPPRSQKKVKPLASAGGNSKGRQVSARPATASVKPLRALGNISNLQTLLALFGRRSNLAETLAWAIAKLKESDDGGRQRVRQLETEKKVLLRKNRKLTQRLARIAKTAHP